MTHSKMQLIANFLVLICLYCSLCTAIVGNVAIDTVNTDRCIINNSTSSVVAAPLSLPSYKARVLVTGAAGFIGSHVAVYCATELNLTVIGIDDLSGPIT